MKKILLIVLLITANLFSFSYAQNSINGINEIIEYNNNSAQSRLVTIPLLYGQSSGLNPGQYLLDNALFSGSYLRWSFLDAASISYHSQISGNGLFGIVAWDLNSKRVSLYDSASSTPVWEYPVSSLAGNSYVSISDSGNFIAVEAYKNILIFTSQNNTPVFNFEMSSLPDTGSSGPIDITGNGGFIVGCASRNDTSTILAFSKESTISVWKYRVPKAIQGIRLSGNDSLVIVNTYSSFWVFNTYTGEKIFQDTIQYGTQMKQGISGNGNIIAQIDYRGWLRVYQWTGTTYSLLWQNQEPPGTYYNWITSVDVSYDGQYVACGTLNFLSSNSYDGKVKFYKVSSGSTPLWIHTGFGDQVTGLEFSRNAMILVACTYGDLSHTKDDFYAFRVTETSPLSVFSINTPGSLYDCSVSDDGTSAITGGKKVHARIFGSGGELYNVFIDTASGSTGINPEKQLPVSFELYQNYPNPFNYQTKIDYDIPQNGIYKISVFDILGREVKVLTDSYHKQGTYSVLFEAGNLSSGIYFYKITSDKYNNFKSMVFLK